MSEESPGRPREWVTRILLESSLIVFSILLALAVNDWHTRQADRELGQQALRSFRDEIRQNRSRLEDVAPFRRGLREVIGRPGTLSRIRSTSDFQMTIGTEGFRPAFLTETAWETSLATGALTHIDFQTVRALSLTYALQRRLTEFARANFPPLVRGEAVAPEAIPGAMKAAAAYLDELTADEAELKAAYDQALGMLAPMSTPRGSVAGMPGSGRVPDAAGGGAGEPP